MADTVVDAHYGDTGRLCRAFADALNSEILALVKAGCRFIQLDEPVFTRYIPEALDSAYRASNEPSTAARRK